MGHQASPACRGQSPCPPSLICIMYFVACFGSGLLPWSWHLGSAPAFAVLSCPRGLLTQGQHAFTGSGLPAGSQQGCPGPLKAQGLPPWPSLSEAGRQGGISVPGLAVTSARLLTPLGCTPSPVADSTMNSSHSLPKLPLSTTARPGEGDLSLPQACKHRSHTRGRAPAANKSWPQGSLKEAAPGTDSRPALCGGSDTL